MTLARLSDLAAGLVLLLMVAAVLAQWHRCRAQGGQYSLAAGCLQREAIVRQRLEER